MHFLLAFLTAGCLPISPHAYAYLAYLGCYKDSADRDLDGEMINYPYNNTPQNCVSHCRGKGFNYASVQASSWCLCGDRYEKYWSLPESSCSSTCTGDRFLTCGGPWANEVYRISGRCPRGEPCAWNGILARETTRRDEEKTTPRTWRTSPPNPLCPISIPDGFIPSYCRRSVNNSCPLICYSGCWQTRLHLRCVQYNGGVKWENADSACDCGRKIRCSSELPNGKMSVSVCTGASGSTCSHFTCNPGYYRAHHELYCNVDGTWTPEDPCHKTTPKVIESEGPSVEIGIIAILGSILLLICLCCVYAFKRSRQKHRRTIGTDNNPTAEVNDTINSLAGVRATLAGVRAMLSHSQSLDARTSQIFNRNTSGHTATSALQTRDVPELLHIPELGSAGATNYHCDSPPPAYDSVVFVKLDDPDLLPTYAEVIAHPSEFSHQDNRPA